MTTLFFTAGIFATAMVGMAFGVIFSNKPLKGSCGGVGGDCACDKAGTPGACKTTGDNAGAADSRFVPQERVIGVDFLRKN